MQSYNLSGKEDVEQQLLEMAGDDIKPTDDDYIKEELTIVVKPNEEIINELRRIIKLMSDEFPDQYYYESNQLHLTLLGGLDPTKITETDVIKALEEYFPLFPIELTIEHLGTSPYVISTIGFPKNDNVHLLREKLRSKLGIGTDYTAIKSFWEHLMWMNFIRYRTKPTEEFMHKLKELRNITVGKIKIDKVFLYKNSSKTLNPKDSKLLKEIRL